MNTKVTPPQSESEAGDSTPLQIHVRQPTLLKGKNLLSSEEKITVQNEVKLRDEIS